MNRISAAIIAFLIVSSPAIAQTTIPGGSVSGTWNLAGSPYLVQGEIQVDFGSSLQIDAGVDVIFEGYYKFIVQGILTAAGEQGDSIRFYPSDPQTAWHGIRFVNAPSLTHWPLPLH